MPLKCLCCFLFVGIQRLQQMLRDKIDEPIASSHEENEHIELDDETSANYINTSVDDVSEGYSHLKKISVF